MVRGWGVERRAQEFWCTASCYSQFER